MPELADIFRGRHENLDRLLNGEQRHAVRDIIACRTPEMGRGALYCCPDCGTEHFIWRSCGNRNCPKCGNDKVTKWLALRQAELLPVDYYLVTFTLPGELHALCRNHPREVYGAFFKSSSEALKELAMDKRFLGAKIGALGTLQTWRRDGGFHPHIHYLCPGGGLSANGKYWVYPKNKKFLIAEKPLAKLFKGKFKSELAGMELEQAVPASAWEKTWVADCLNAGNGMTSFKYLAPYMQRGFIGNDRIEAYDGENVTFRYKKSDGQTVRKTMLALAFMLLFLQHVLPSGFQKTRYYGLLGNANKQTVRELAIMILTSRDQPPPEPESFNHKPLRCNKCGAVMLLSEVNARAPPPGVVVI